MPEVFVTKQKPAKKRFKVKESYLILVGLIAIVLIFVFVSKQKEKPEAAENIATNSSGTTGSNTPDPLPLGVAKNFTGEQFQSLYEDFAYPNTQELQRPIVITGNANADAKIELLAIAKGYRLRPVAVTGLLKVGNELLQPLAYQAWQQLVELAKNDGISLNLTSGFRSPSDQRELFVSRLYARGVSASEVAAGKADSAVNSVLSTTAIPGYSKHHSGFTVDIGCGNEPNKNFESSVCFSWLNENNYIHTKTVGWIPSYPKEATNQGPAPEAWEYVWVGTSPLFD